MIELIECPRDAMQGMHEFVPTDVKANYINKLLKVGFHTIDFGSFVSPKAIPQMKDTAEVLSKLDLSNTSSKLLAIVANLRGVNDAAQHNEISYLGFPLSVSETFQKRNTNKTIVQALDTIAETQEVCLKKKKTQVVYLSMGFGNPYNDPYSPEIVATLSEKLVKMGIKIIALSDTVGASNPKNIKALYQLLTKTFEKTTFGVHLHSTPRTSLEKIRAAYEAGCRRFDGAIKGFGGCPMAKDDLTGNTATEVIIDFLDQEKSLPKTFEKALFQEAFDHSSQIFG